MVKYILLLVALITGCTQEDECHRAQDNVRYYEDCIKDSGCTMDPEYYREYNLYKMRVKREC